MCHILFCLPLNPKQFQEGRSTESIINAIERVSQVLPGGLSPIGLSRPADSDVVSRSQVARILRAAKLLLLIDVSNRATFYTVAGAEFQAIDPVQVNMGMDYHSLRIPVRVTLRNHERYEDIIRWFDTAVCMRGSCDITMRDSVEIKSHAALVRVCDWEPIGQPDSLKLCAYPTLLCCVPEGSNEEKIKDGFCQSLGRFTQSDQDWSHAMRIDLGTDCKLLAHVGFELRDTLLGIKAERPPTSTSSFPSRSQRSLRVVLTALIIALLALFIQRSFHES